MTDRLKILVIAEKPSVGRDLARVLPGPFAKSEGSLEGPEHVISWAVGHLVQLAEPDEYDAKFKRWRMADLPIVPDRFKLVVRDERSRKQMSVVTRLLHRDDIVEVVNACSRRASSPAGRSEANAVRIAAFVIDESHRRRTGSVAPAFS